jgi:hypothetical protein
MKLILLDLLRRWGWVYLLGFVLATTFDLFAKYVGPFAVFTPYFLAPMLGPLFVVASDMMRGVARVTSALPVSAKNVGLSYWIVGVCIPPVLLSLALILANMIAPLLSPTTTTVWDQVGVTFVVSFLISGSIFFDLTLFNTALSNSIIGTVAGALWGVGAFSSMGVKFLFDLRKGDTVTMTSLVVIGLLFTVLGYIRSGEMVKHRARNRIARPSASRKPTASAAVPASAPPRISGLSYLFLESLKFALGVSVVLMLFGTVFPLLENNWMFVNSLLLIWSVLSGLRFFTRLRHIRSLPISIDRLALIILALPLLNFLVCLAVIVAIEAIFHHGAFRMNQQLFAIAGLATFGTAVALRFGPQFLPFIMGLGMMAVFGLTEFNLPVAASCTLTALLMIAAYGIVRRSLQSGKTYRVPATSFPVG